MKEEKWKQGLCTGGGARQGLQARADDTEVRLPCEKQGMVTPVCADGLTYTTHHTFQQHRKKRSCCYSTPFLTGN